MALELDYMEYSTDELAQSAYVTSAGVDGSTTFIDDGNTGHTVTANADAQVDTTNKKWGAGGLQLDGTEDSLSIPGSDDFNIISSNADNWTIDFWVKHNTYNTTEGYICFYEDASNKWEFMHYASATGIRFLTEGGGTVISLNGGQITDSNWHHIVLCKVADKYGIYKDGTQVAYTQNSDTDTLVSSYYLKIGDRTSGANLNGYMDEIRIQHSNYFSASPNIGLTNTITPPTGEYASDSNTKLLLHCNGVANLQCYSEDTILEQGSYSLKASATDGALNDTLTKSGLSIDLTDLSTLKFYARSSRTGTNLQLQIHDSGGTTSTKDIAISSADTWEQITWDISGISNANKDDIDSIIIKITNADSANTIYVDDFYAITITTVILDIINQYNLAKEELLDINNKFYLSELELADIINKFNLIKEDLLNIFNKYNLSKTELVDILNKYNTIKLLLPDIINKFNSVIEGYILISNANIDDEDMTDISDWNDGDSGTGVSSQVIFDNKSCMKLDTGANTGSGAYRTQDIGSFGDRTIFSFNIYFDLIGEWAQDVFLFRAYNGTTVLDMAFGTDGLRINNGIEHVLIDADIVVLDTWQEWTFVVDWIAKTVDIYLDKVLKYSDVDCSAEVVYINGIVVLNQIGYDNPNHITYIDWFKAGSSFSLSNINNKFGMLLGILSDISNKYNLSKEEVIDIDNKYNLSELELADIINRFNLSKEESSDILNKYNLSKEELVDILNKYYISKLVLGDIANKYNTTLPGILLNILNKYNTTKLELVDINNKFNTEKLVLLDIINKFNSVIEVLSDDINSKFNFSSEILANINNELRDKKLVLSNIQVNFRMKLQIQVPIIGKLQPLGKSYFTVKINNVDITDSLNVNIDTLHWREMLNAPAEANFVLALPYDSGSKPNLGESVEILFNDNRKFYGYITKITKSITPEGISIQADGEYYNFNKEVVNFYIGRKSDNSIEEIYHLTYKQALSSLGLDLDIGDFVPLTENYTRTNKADAISQILRNCGNFAWFIKPNGIKKLWRAGKGSILNLERQSIGENLSLYQVINHNIVEDDTNKIDRIKAVMGDDIKVGYDNTWRDVRYYTVFKEKFDNDNIVYTKPFFENVGWRDLRENQNLENSKEVISDGWRIIVPPGYDKGFPLKIKNPGINVHSETGKANDNIQDILQIVTWYEKGGIYPEGRKERIFYVGSEPGSGIVTQTLELSNLNRQYGNNYERITDIFPYSFQRTEPSTFGALNIIPVLKKVNVIIPSWDDTEYATDIANSELEKFKDTKITGTLSITFDCADFYELDLSKKIKCDGILDTPINIVAIDYDVGSYLVTVTIESANYYKRSVSIQTHNKIETV